MWPVAAARPSCDLLEIRVRFNFQAAFSYPSSFCQPLSDFFHLVFQHRPAYDHAAIVRFHLQQPGMRDNVSELRAYPVHQLIVGDPARPVSNA